MLYNHFVRRMSVMLTDAENAARRLRIAVESGSSSAQSRIWPSARRRRRHGPKPRRPATDGIYDPNLTPLIDVSLVLVVILLVATPMALQSGIARGPRGLGRQGRRDGA